MSAVSKAWAKTAGVKLQSGRKLNVSHHRIRLTAGEGEEKEAYSMMDVPPKFPVSTMKMMTLSVTSGISDSPLMNAIRDTACQC